LYKPLKIKIEARTDVLGNRPMNGKEGHLTVSMQKSEKKMGPTINSAKIGGQEAEVRDQIDKLPKEKRKKDQNGFNPTTLKKKRGKKIGTRYSPSPKGQAKTETSPTPSKRKNRTKS